MSTGPSQPSEARDHILIVDDNPNDLRYLTRLLSEHGYVALVATRATRVMEFLQVSVPDLILLDLNLPEMDGHALCRALKQQDRLKDVPVIFVSAETSMLDRVRALAEGAADYLTKPLQAEELLSRIETQLSLRRLVSRLAEAEAQAGRDRQDRARELAGIGLDLRAPLDEILGLVAILQSAAAPQDAQQTIAALRRSGTRLQFLLDSIPGLSPLAVDDVSPLEEASTELAITFGIVGDMMRTRAQVRGVRWVQAFTGEALPLAIVDERRLARVLLILFGHSLNCAPECMAFHVDTAIDRSSSTATLRVGIQRGRLDALQPISDSAAASPSVSQAEAPAQGGVHPSVQQAMALAQSMGSACRSELQTASSHRFTLDLRFPLAAP